MTDPTFLETYGTAVNVFLCLSGLALHMVMKWAEYRHTVAKVGLAGYVSEFPAQTAVAVIGSVVAFGGAFALDWLNPGMAIACGYMGNSVAENLANKYAAGK
jgi:hypothetical protein